MANHEPTAERVEDLGPFHNRSWEWALYLPLVGSSMLELGNKRNGALTYKAFFKSRGYRHVSVDWNGEDGALRKDLRQPLNLGTFDMVCNIGTTEHVEGQEGVWRNICEAMHMGSVLVSLTPMPGHWLRHGLHYPTQEFYQQLADRNGLRVERLYDFGCEGRRNTCTRMIRERVSPFSMPDLSTIYLNR